MQHRRGASLAAVVALVVAAGVSVPTASATVRRVVHAPSQACINFSHPHVVGGNNLLEGNPGNVSSTDWLRGEGVQATFAVPADPTVRTDCLGPAAGIALKLRMVDVNNQLTDTSVIMGINWENEYDPFYQQFTPKVPVWGVSYGTNAEGTSWDDEIPRGNVTLGLCQLTPGNTVTLRIVNNTNGGWTPYCLNPQNGSWVDMKFGGGGFASGYVEGISLLSRWRAGTVGGLNLTASALKWKDSYGTWNPWSNSDCFSNTTTDYLFNGGSSANFTIAAGTPNPNC